MNSINEGNRSKTASTAPVQSYSVAVLAGGRGSRLGGADKGLLRVDGQTAVERVLESIPACVPRVIIANRNLVAYRRLGVPVWADSWPDHGPLAGILTALQVSTTPWIQIVPCDGLALPSDISSPLLRAAEAVGAAAAFPLYNGHGQYTCCILNRDLTRTLEQALHSGERRLRYWLASAGAVPVDFGTVFPSPIWSVNTPEEWRRASERLAGSR